MIGHRVKHARRAKRWKEVNNGLDDFFTRQYERIQHWLDTNPHEAPFHFYHGGPGSRHGPHRERILTPEEFDIERRN